MHINTEILDKIRNWLIKKKQTIAVAESVTSGNIQAAFSLAKDAEKFFQGGITTYNLGQKSRHLCVEPIEALGSNCVSKVVAAQMAKNVCEMFLADFGIGITGFASLAPEKNIKQLYAFISIAKKDKLLLTKKIAAKILEPREVQLFYTNEAIKMLNSVLIK